MGKMVWGLVFGAWCLVSGCMTDSTKNMPGTAGVEIAGPTNTVTITTVQPENPNQEAIQIITFGPAGELLSITQGTGGAFKNKTAGIKGLFSMAKIYIYASIFCALIGALILSFTKDFKNKIGWSMFGLAGIFAAVGSILPNLGTYIAIVAVLVAVGGIGYILITKGHLKQLTGKT